MLFFELLQIAIGNRHRLSQTPTEGEWRELFLLAKKQALVGIAFRAVEQLPEEQRPPKALLMQWYIATERIKAMNANLDCKALGVIDKLLVDGFPGVVLKGQGIARLYRVGGNDGAKLPIGNYRTPGDVDVWLFRERQEILEYVRSHVPDCKPVYHHVDFPVIEGLDIEIHFTPSWMNSPLSNKRLQRFFDIERLRIIKDSAGFPIYRDGSQRTSIDELPVPSLAFDRVFILVHIYRHLFAEGIGLRQLLDYYFVLSQGFTLEEREDTVGSLRSLKMLHFAGAVMWVLREVFALDERYMLVEPNEQEGHFLLGEIMQAGNFGQYDERLQHRRGESALSWGMRKVVRSLRFVHSYPSEVLWGPIFKVWNYWGRKLRW